MKAYLLALFLTSFKHCRQIQDRQSLVPVPLIRLSENPVDLSIKNVMSLVVANNNRTNSTLRYTFPFTFVLISLCPKKIEKKPHLYVLTMSIFRYYKHALPSFQNGNWIGLKWPLSLKFEKKSCEGLDKFILSLYEKFHCLTLSSYGGDSGTNKVRT